MENPVIKDSREEEAKKICDGAHVQYRSCGNGQNSHSRVRVVITARYVRKQKAVQASLHEREQRVADCRYGPPELAVGRRGSGGARRRKRSLNRGSSTSQAPSKRQTNQREL